MYSTCNTQAARRVWSSLHSYTQNVKQNNSNNNNNNNNNNNSETCLKTTSL